MASGDLLVAFPPQSHQPPATGGARFSVRNGHTVLHFAAAGSEEAYFTAVMPAFYGGGNLVAAVTWLTASATSGTGGWTVEFERLAAGAQDLDSNGFASAQTITSATVPGSTGVLSRNTVTVTAGANTDSIAASELFRVRVKRGTDSATGDIGLVQLTLSEA